LLYHQSFCRGGGREGKGKEKRKKGARGSQRKLATSRSMKFTPPFIGKGKKKGKRKKKEGKEKKMLSARRTG